MCYICERMELAGKKIMFCESCERKLRKKSLIYERFIFFITSRICDLKFLKSFFFNNSVNVKVYREQH